MTTQQQTETNYWKKKLEAFVGGKIHSIATSVPEDVFDDVYLGINIQMPGGQIWQVVLLSDEEGNGAGRFSVECLGKVAPK